MTTSIVDAESVLAVDIGSIHTRALLFDVVDGQYRFISSGVVSSTHTAPFFDTSEGVFQAVKKLQELTGREFLDGEAQLILPTSQDGRGVDQMVITFTAGPMVRIVTMGLLEDVSLESANRLANSVPGEVVESIGLNDRRKSETQLDAIIQAKPDLILLAGGTNGGATRSVARLAELVSLTLQVLPRDQRPEVIYAGNQALAKHIQDSLEPIVNVQVAANVRPGIDQEEYGPGQEKLARAISHIHSKKLGGLQSLASMVGFTPLPTSFAFGRMIRFISQIYGKTKGVLGVDLGAGSTTFASAKQGKLSMSVSPLGLGTGLLAALEEMPTEDILQWLSSDIQAEVVRDYLYNKALYPATIPATEESQEIEQAMARQILLSVSQQFKNSWPGMSLAFDPILAGGQVLTQGASAQQSMLTLLDGLQPVGISTIILDPYALLPSLGALAEENTLLPAQVIDSNAFVSLGTVIAPVCQAKYGTPVLEARMEYDQENQTEVEIKQGTITVFPLRPGQVGNLHFKPLRPMQIDPVREKVRSFRVPGGVCGVLIDTRGRPLQLPSDHDRRRELLKKWSQAIA